MATITSITITVSTSELITKIRRNLAIIGKRARRNNGESMYSDLTASTNEEPLYDDLLMFGAQTIVSNLSELCTTYIENDASNSVDGVIAFMLISARLNTNDSVQQILTKLVKDYLYNFVLARYLSEIHPSTGDKYPPLFGKTYSDACDTLMLQIRNIAFLKRPKEGSSSLGYNSVGLNSTSVSVGEDGSETPIVLYYTKTEMDSLLSAKQNLITEEWKLALLNGYVTLSDLSVYAKTSDLTALSNSLSLLSARVAKLEANASSGSSSKDGDTEQETTT